MKISKPITFKVHHLMCDRTDIITYPSIKEAANNIGCSISTLFNYKNNVYNNKYILINNNVYEIMN